jgi:dTDP-4-amino-4,6-dideoxygalactose transaminase
VPGLTLPARGRATHWNGALYTLRVHEGRRDALREHLVGAGIEARVYYDLPLHLQAVFAHLGYGPGDFPVAEQAAREVLSLPLYPGLADEAVQRVVAAVRGFRG